jgi:hypothetical protein
MAISSSFDRYGKCQTPKHTKGGAQAAGKGILLHLISPLNCYLPKGAYWNKEMRGHTLAAANSRKQERYVQTRHRTFDEE